MRHISVPRIAFASLALVGALTLAGCSAGASDSGGPMAPQPDTGYVSEDGAGGSAGSETGGDLGAGGKDATDTRELITIGTVQVTAEDPIEAAADAVKVVEAAGGRVDGRSEHGPSEYDNGSATLVLRIPASALTATLDKLKALGTDDQVEINSTDVTTEHQDLDARISAQRTMIANLEVLMTKAVKIEDLITLESTIADRQSQLESLEAQERGLSDQVAMSTITLTLVSEPTDPPSTAPTTFWDGLVAGWGAFLAFWSGLLVVVGVLLPWLITAGAITAAVLLLVRWNRKRIAARTQA